MKLYREMRGKCKCDMVVNSYKISNVERMFLGGYRSTHTVKNYFGAYE